MQKIEEKCVGTKQPDERGVAALTRRGFDLIMVLPPSSRRQAAVPRGAPRSESKYK